MVDGWLTIDGNLVDAFIIDLFILFLIFGLDSATQQPQSVECLFWIISPVFGYSF
jgi:hypothetical protein